METTLSSAQLPVTPLCETKLLSSSSVQQALSTSSPDNSSENINSILIDSLLAEILRRLPYHSALRAKSVCKHWFSLPSDPYFLKSFKHFHDQRCHGSHCSLPFTLVYEFNYWHRHLTENLHSKVHAISKHAILQSQGFHLDFLPCFRSWESQPVRVIASHNDLLVCSDPNMSLQGVYYICNPLTKQWFALPPAPSYHRVADTAIGFISSDELTSRFRYKLVRVPELDSQHSNQFEVEVFCSELGKWSKFVINSSPRSFKRTWQFKPDAISLKNRLHWLVNGEIIVVFDPYEGPKGSCQVIDLPFELNSEIAICLGSCQNHLKVSQIAGRWPRRMLVVWKLQDYVSGNWSLEYKVVLNDMVFVDDQYFGIFRYLTVELLAFHPSDDEILYLRFDNHIVMCNMGRKTLEVVSECLKDSTFSIGTRGVFLLVHPCWPSLIPPLLPI